MEQPLTTKVDPQAKGGLLDLLINKGSLPSVQMEVSNDTLIHFGIMIVLSVTIVLIIASILKVTILKIK